MQTKLAKIFAQLDNCIIPVSATTGKLDLDEIKLLKELVESDDIHNLMNTGQKQYSTGVNDEYSFNKEKALNYTIPIVEEATINNNKIQSQGKSSTQHSDKSVQKIASSTGHSGSLGGGGNGTQG